jgi:hypothetical protein
MGKLQDIRTRLSAGSTAAELVNEGYARSSVYQAARKLRQVPASSFPVHVPDELAELKQRKEIIKLQREIADLEAARDRLPDRVAALEEALTRQQSILRDAVDTAVGV